ncbi:thioredoxin-disulfide reductase [Candidatus Aerophobetes bacterium]|uniref:Thioredoxin reductase n=1 Tax=Aerophobetes bacterium TaxID=2030807 RepID=A0A2A4X664_UNCAE|nr:MAG: thioredoxin-disulfide reductase [Candidatus Aerophobetes bacterium]
MRKEKVVIIGSGPAAFTAAIYAARANLSPLVFMGFMSGPPGGQLMTTTDVENFPGFPKGIMGPDLMKAMEDQAKRFSTVCLAEDVKKVDLSKGPFLVESSKTQVLADSLIIATGANAKKLDIPGAGEGEGEFWQRGVSACAVCDGAMPIFKDKHVYVIGGGDTAVEEAIFLTKYASRVFIVHRRDTLRASKIMAKHAQEHPKVEILFDHVLTKVSGDKVVTHVEIEHVGTGKKEEREAGGVFFAIGHTPNTAFLNGQIELDATGYIQVEAKSSQVINKPGVFACGDVQDKIYRQAVTSAGSGCMAALDAERYLTQKGLS